MHKFASKDQAISDLENLYPIPYAHHKADADVKKVKEYFALRSLLRTDFHAIQFPLEIEHCGERQGWPDFIVSFNGVAHLVEVTEITDSNSQRAFQKKALLSYGIEDVPLGQNNITSQIRESVQKKNHKLGRYRELCGAQKSLLLLLLNQMPVFEYGSPGDVLNIEEIKSNFDYTVLLTSVYESDRGYVLL